MASTRDHSGDGHQVASSPKRRSHCDDIETTLTRPMRRLRGISTQLYPEFRYRTDAEGMPEACLLPGNITDFGVGGIYLYRKRQTY